MVSPAVKTMPLFLIFFCDEIVPHTRRFTAKVRENSLEEPTYGCSTVVGRNAGYPS